MNSRLRIVFPCTLLFGLFLASLATSCGDSGTTDGSGDDVADGGTDTGMDAGTEAGTDMGDTTTSENACTSNTFWTMGDLESPLMHPGGACLTCHDQQVGEDIVGRLAIAGTVYPTLHEPDDCNGVTAADGPVTVEITTADNVVLSLPVNTAGNFFYDLEENPAINFPITAKVMRGDQELAMVAMQQSGDCNSCHTEQGSNGAPGRIMAP